MFWFALVPAKWKHTPIFEFLLLIEELQLWNSFLIGSVMLQGDLHDHESLVKAIKQVDVVISTVGRAQFSDQVKIIAAIKEAGNVKVKSSKLTKSLPLLFFFLFPSLLCKYKFLWFLLLEFVIICR